MTKCLKLDHLVYHRWAVILVFVRDVKITLGDRYMQDLTHADLFFLSQMLHFYNTLKHFRCNMSASSEVTASTP